MIRLLSIACIALWLSGCANQATNTAQTEGATTAAPVKSCDQTYPAVREAASAEHKECSDKNCPHEETCKGKKCAKHKKK